MKSSEDDDNDKKGKSVKYEDDDNSMLKSEKTSIRKIRALLYEESINFSENNTYYKSTNIHNYNNINAYFDYIKKSKYARTYEQENIYNEALNLYNNRNLYKKKRYLNNFYANIRRNLHKNEFFGDDNEYIEEDQKEENASDLIERTLNQNIYKVRKREQSVLFCEKYKELFTEDKTNLKNVNEIHNRRKTCKRNPKEKVKNTNLLNDIKELNSFSDANTFNEKDENFLEKLIKLQYTPEQISQLSDLFENPKTLKSVNVKILKWLNNQLNNGYWLERFSLFLLGLTIAIGVGNIETIWFLMSTWHGVIFILPYILCYVFVCHPILSFELYVGQLVRTSSPFVFYRLLKQSASVGFLMVLTCLINSYINSYRTAAEYFIYLINSFKKELPWKLNSKEIDFCTSFKNDFVNCHKYRPLCLFSMSTSSCVPNNLGKAFLIYQHKFFPKNELYNSLLSINKDNSYINIFSKGDSYIDKDTLFFLFVCNFLVTIFQLFGLTNFAFCSALVLLLIGFLSITQFATMFNLSGATQAYSHVLKSWEISYIYTYSSLWSQCVSFALYELSIGIGIYSSLATKSRIGTNLAFDGYAITIWNSIISALMFFSAVAVIGFISKSLNSNFVDILDYSRKDCSFVLFPVGFTYLKKMEKTLCMLYYGSYAVLSCASLAIQYEVLVMTIKDFKFSKNKKKRTIILTLSIFFFLASFFISNVDAKNVIWFLTFTISENGRVFVALLICIILGWLYNTQAQFQALTTACVLSFNITFWILNLTASILFNYLDYHIYVLNICRLIIFIVSTIVALLVLKVEVHLNRNELEFFYNNLTFKDILYTLYLGNIESLRKELQRIISGNVYIGNISMFWSICIKYIATSILLSAFIEFADGVFYSSEVKEKIKVIPKGWVFFSICFWIFTFLLLSIFPFFTNLFEKYCAPDDYFIDFSLLPSKPLKEIQNFNILSYFYEFKNSNKKKRKKKKKDKFSLTRNN
ncbi:transporter, putative [Plasmodium gallinaceum]|uniref:Transporter, putative n=1 Tax=Plasmodium gallinaceum TaxID=5849 RepID=A0A1J1GSA9_PLAGA|nr:transporter, putative [Plasmodium gallinaceum]CRG95385.1 transporter, putative [Plasmodium gallinaceum]